MWEDERGRIRRPDPEHHQALAQERLLDVRDALRHINRGANVSMLQVGCRTGQLLKAMRDVFSPRQLQGLEPWTQWRKVAAKRGFEVLQSPIEEWNEAAVFDVIVDVDLISHLAEPVEHLKAVVAHLAPDGLAVIGVPNLVGIFGELACHILRGDSPYAYTARALATASRAAGLLPVRIVTGTELRMICRKSPPAPGVVSGPTSLEVARSVLGNDLRLSVKRALCEDGPTLRVLQTAARVHKRCPCPGTRADIAIEIAAHCERCADYEGASQWLATSLEDRPDTEVEATRAQLLKTMEQIRVVVGQEEELAASIERTVDAPAEEPTPTAPEPAVALAS